MKALKWPLLKQLGVVMQGDGLNLCALGAWVENGTMVGGTKYFLSKARQREVGKTGERLFRQQHMEMAEELKVTVSCFFSNDAPGIRISGHGIRGRPLHGIV